MSMSYNVVPNRVYTTLYKLGSVTLAIFTSRWYHGKISRDIAEQRLKALGYEAFLIRESENRLGQFSLSIRHNGIVKHFRIDRKRGSGRFELFGAHMSFIKLPELVEYYTQHCLSSGGEVLSAPCRPEVCLHAAYKHPVVKLLTPCIPKFCHQRGLILNLLEDT